MPLTTLLLIVVLGTVAAYFLGLTRSRAIAKPLGGVRNLATLPSYYATSVSMWVFIPAIFLLFIWITMDGMIIDNIVRGVLPEAVKQRTPEQVDLALNQVKNVASNIGSIEAIGEEFRPAVDKLTKLNNVSTTSMPILTVLVMIIGVLLGYRSIKSDNNARYAVEKVFNITLLACSSIAILTTVGIVFSVIFESLRFFEKIPFFDFLFGTHWSPQIAIRSDQVGASGAFGVIPLIAGTLLISFIALLIAVPIGLMSAIYLSEYADSRARGIIKPALEILAGVPTVVYGFFAALTVAPAIRRVGNRLRDWAAENDISWLAELNVASESALAAGLVMGIMIIPFVSSLSDDVINAVPQSLRDGSYGLGATQSETIKKVIFPAALPGIVGGVLLAASRAIGETMIVVMAAGLAANLTINPLEAVTTVTVQIVTLLVGDQEFDSAKTLAAFALGLFLFVITLMLNMIALRVVKKYREQYD